MRPRTIVDAFDGPFSAWLGDPAGWSSWRVFLRALAGLPLETPVDAELFTCCTGRTAPPEEPVTEAWVVAGRRARKSATAAMIGVYQAVYPDWPRAAGETLRVLIIANTKDQAGLIRSYCEAILRSRPGLARLILACDAETITLRNGIEIKCVANSFRSIRGPTVVCAILEEAAFWRDETSANPDKEVLRAIKPSMLTVKGAVLIGISSPYAKKGLLYERHRDHFGRDNSKVLVWQADTLTMNPAADPEEIAEAYREDPIAAAAEFGAQFRDDLSAFLDPDLLAELARPSPLELPPREGISYSAFADPSGGRGDAFALAIGHQEPDGRGVVDVVRAVAAPFDPSAAVKAHAELLKAYRVAEVVGDHYSGEWVAKAFEAEGVKYRTATKPKSAIYQEALPRFTRGEVQLPDDRRLLVELASLERRTARSGKDSIDHPRGAHDDKANVVCGLLVELQGRRGLSPDARIDDLAVIGRPLVVKEYGTHGPWLDMSSFERDYPL